jgi:hypothetical protein
MVNGISFERMHSLQAVRVRTSLYVMPGGDGLPTEITMSVPSHNSVDPNSDCSMALGISSSVVFLPIRPADI